MINLVRFQVSHYFSCYDTYGAQSYQDDEWRQVVAPWPGSSKTASFELVVINYTSMFVFSVIFIMFFHDDIITY